MDIILRKHDEDPGDFDDSFQTIDDYLYYRIKNDPNNPNTTKEFEEYKGIYLLFSIRILNEAVDIPCCDSILITYPTKSKISTIQRINRATRIQQENPFKIANIFLTGKDEIAEDYGDTIKDFAQSLKSQSLGKLSKPKLDEGGYVESSGVAEVHSGETYLGASSLQLIKMTADNSTKTVELLTKLVTQKPDASNAQVRFVTGNVMLDGVPTGKLVLNSFQNNSYTNFDTTRYNS